MFKLLNILEEIKKQEELNKRILKLEKENMLLKEESLNMFYHIHKRRIIKQDVKWVQ